MLKSAKRNKISSLGLFYILFICRVAVSLTSVHSVSKSEITSSMLLSYIIALLLTALLCVPVILCYRLGKNPVDSKIVGKFYYAYFIFITALSVSRFSYFASTTLNPETGGWVFALIICLCAFYGASLGIEALSRFSAFCFALLIIGIFSVLICNVDTFEEINLYPVKIQDGKNFLQNVFTFASNTSELAVFLCIFPKVNGKVERSFIRSVCLSFLVVFLLLYVALGVMGSSMTLRSFPFYSFFQISKFGNFERLDVLHISFWIMSVFVKGVTSIYCACVSFSKNTDRKNCFFTFLITFALSIVLLRFSEYQSVTLNISMMFFVAFCVVIPILTLIFKKKNYGDELVKIY